MLPPGGKGSLLDEQCARIVPFKACASLRDAGEEVLEEVRRFRSCLERLADSRGQTVVYIETVADPKRTGWHTCPPARSPAHKPARTNRGIRAACVPPR